MATLDSLTLVILAAVAFAATAALALAAPTLARLGGPRPVLVVAAVAAVAAAAAGGEPTGLEALDVVLRAALAAGMALAASRAHPAAVVAAVAVVAVAGVNAELSWPVFAALGVAAATVTTGLTSPVLGAVAGGAAAQTALRLTEPEAAGASAAVVALAVAVIAVSALACSPPPTRRRVLVASAAVAVAGAAATVAFGVAALGARASLVEATADARAGLDASRRGSGDAAVASLRSAAVAFARAEDRLGAWWARPARAVPIVGPNARALEQLAASGAELARVAGGAAAEADPDALQVRGATVDLAALSALHEPLRRASGALERADAELAAVRSPWLVPPMSDALDDLSTRVHSAAPRAADAAAVAEVAPGLLGAGGPRRYFLALQNPAELRGSGGLLGSFGELTAVDGRMELVRTGRARDLNSGGTPMSRSAVELPEYLDRFGVPESDLLWGDVTFSPHFPSVAQAIEAAYPHYGGRPLDGVISLDPIAIAAVLELTGPVEVPEWPEPIGAGNAADVLLRDQYLRLGTDGFTNPDRVDFLDSLLEALFARLETTALPGPGRVADVLGPMVRQGRLTLHATRPGEQAVLERLGAAGALPPVRGDYVGLVTNNSGGNKIDTFLDRALSYRAVFDPASGKVSATAEVRLDNHAPGEGLPDYVIGSAGQVESPPGTNRMFLSLYSPLVLEGATVDGEPLPMETLAEQGRNVYSALVSVPPGGTATVVLELSGVVGGGRAYRLDIGHQPTVDPDAVEVTIEAAPGWRFAAAEGVTVADGGASATLALEHPEHQSATFRPG